tara:strand:+ start:117 stop:329 length:213 start_codon:yes stop_codon:yes gene_type:complete
MSRYKIVNGERIQFTAEEEAARDAEEAQAEIEIQASIDAKETKKNKKASGKQKLKDLGLDDDEIQALIGE